MKIFRTMLFLIIAILMTYAVPAFATTWEDATGPYSTTVVGDTGPDKMYYIYRPQTLRSSTHPIVVLCVGTGAHPKNYDVLLTQLASHGVVVIASIDPYQEDGSKASAGVNWIVGQNEISKSEYYQKLIPSRVLAIGHSAGGAGAMWASIKNSKITSLLLYAPVFGSVNSSDLLVPTFFISGALDTTVPPHFVKARYQEATKANAWYGENTNQSHTGFGRNTSIQYYTRAWVYTHLFNDSGTARGCFYGPDWTFKGASYWSDKLKNNSVF
jgi:dienelactone hydrolase